MHELDWINIIMKPQPLFPLIYNIDNFYRQHSICFNMIDNKV
jgi:hypothetical protein